MKNLIKSHRTIAFAAVVFLFLMAISMVWDLEISNALYNPSSIAAKIVESTCFIPLYAYTICLIAFIAADKKQSVLVRFISTLICAFCASILIFVVLQGLQKINFIAGFTLYTALILGCIVTIILLISFRIVKNTFRSKIYFLLIFATVYMVANNIIIILIKLIWQRTRFLHMFADGSFDDFTVWLRPFGNGGSSFPSGHTGAAGAVFVLIICCDLFTFFAKNRKIVYLLCWAYVAFCGINRVIIGRHFLSDVTAAAFIALVLVLLMQQTSIYKKQILKL